MKKLVFLMMLLIAPMLVIAQISGEHVTRPPKKQTTVVTPDNNNNNKKKRDNAGKRDRVNNRVNTPSQREEQPKPKQVEAAGYDVTFSCNVPSASMLIDGIAFGTATGSHFLKTGSHTVKLTADGYEDYSQTINVNFQQTIFVFEMKEDLRMVKKNVIIKALVDNMVYVEGGTFTMGATSEQGSNTYFNEKPVHQVTLSSFSIGKYEVTQEEWEVVMGSIPSGFKGSNLPVEMVSWEDCQEFIRKLNLLTGKKFRLPTEAEWEYAARGGSKSRGYKYAGGNNIGSVAWYDGNSGNKTHEVGQKCPNELGLYDMSGNVWEWCSDWYGSYGSSSQTNPQGPSSDSRRVYRGGGWRFSARTFSFSIRDSYTPDFRDDFLGLRLAL